MSDPDNDWQSFTLKEKALDILPPTMVWLVIAFLIFGGSAIGSQLARHLWWWSWMPAVGVEALFGCWIMRHTRNFYVGMIVGIILMAFTILGFSFTYAWRV